MLLQPKELKKFFKDQAVSRSTKDPPTAVRLFQWTLKTTRRKKESALIQLTINCWPWKCTRG